MQNPRQRPSRDARRLKPHSVPDPFPTIEEITMLAQVMLASHGRNASTAGIIAYWNAAETELLDRAAQRLLTPPASSERRR